VEGDAGAEELALGGDVAEVGGEAVVRDKIYFWETRTAVAAGEGYA
jgi:hypothetical protein